MKEFDPLRAINSFIYPTQLRQSLRLSFARFTLFLGSVMLGVVFFSGLLFAFFYWQINELKDLVLKELEQTIGFSFAYDSIDPHFLSKFKINNARIFDPEVGEEDTLLSFSSLELTIDIWAILGFNPEFLIERVVLNDLTVQVNWESLKERKKFEKIAQLLKSHSEPAKQGIFFTSLHNRRNFSLYFNNLKVALKIPGTGDLTLNTDNISLVLINGRWDLTGFLNLSFLDSQISALPSFSSGLGIKGFGKLDPWQAQLILTVQGFSGDNFQIMDHGYFLSLNSEYLRILNTTGENFSLDVLYEFEPNELKGSFSAQDWKLLNLLSLPNSSSNASFKDFSSYSFSAEGMVQYVKGELSYSLQARTDLDERFPESFQGAVFLDLKGNENWIRIEDLTFENTRGGEISYTGDFSFKDFFPRGELSFSKFTWQASQPLSGSLLMGEVSTGGYFIRSKDLNIGAFPVTSTDIFLVNREGELDFRGILSFSQQEKSQISFTGSYPFKQKLDLNLEMENFPLDQLYLALPSSMNVEAKTLQTVTQGLLSNAQLRGTFDLRDREESVISIFELSAHSQKNPSQGFFFSTSGTKSQVLLSRFDFIGKNFSLMTKGEMDLEPGLIMRSHLNLNINNQKTIPLDLLWHTGDKMVELTSGKILNLLLNYKDGLEGLFTMKDFVFPIRESTLTLNQQLSISAEEGQDWLIDWEKFDLAVENSPFVPAWKLSWQALVTKDILTVENAVFSDNLSYFQGGGVVQDWLSTGRGSFFLTSDKTKESLQFSWLYGAGSLSLDVLAQGLWTEHFQKPHLPIEEGLLDIAASLLWEEGKDLITSVNLRLKDAYWGDSSVKGESSFALLANHLISSSTKFQVADRVFFLDDLNLDLREQTYKFKGYLQQENPKNFRLTEFSRWQGEGSWSENKNELDFKASFFIDRIQQENLKGKSLDFTLTKEGQLFSINSRDELALKGSYHTGTGRVSFNSSDPYPLKMRMEGFVLPDLLDLRIENLSFEVADLPLSLIVSGAFAWHRGLVTGNLFLGGTLDRPEFNGRLNVRGAHISTPYVGNLNLDGTPNEYIVGPFDAAAFATGNLIYLVNESTQWTGVNSLDDLPAIETQVDRDKIAMKGLITLDGWELDRLQLWVNTLTKHRGVPVAFLLAGVKAQGYALGSFLLEMQAENINLVGDFTLNQVDMTLAEEKPKPFRRTIRVEPVVSANFDINLGRSARFLWPNEILPLFRAIANTNQRLKLVVDGANDDFSLVGEVGIRGGNLSYYSSSFLLTKGRIIFNENQDNFDPYIEVQAEMITTDTSGEGVKGGIGNSSFSSRSGQSLQILLTVNSLLSEMLENASLSSSPSRSQDEIRVLLGIGDISFDKIDQARDLGEIGLNLASGLVTNVIFKPIEDFFRNSLNLDYFSLSSDWLKRVSTKWLPTNVEAQQRDFSGSEGIGVSQPTLNATISANKETALDALAEVLDNTRISAGKYIADGVFVEGGFTLSRGRTTYKGRAIRASVDIGFELNAYPLVVGWQAGLDLANFGSFDSLSNQISVSWSFSY